MSIKAMKQALEALELHGKQYPHMVKGYCLDAITSLRQAIAEAEKHEVSQEPVAWMGTDTEGNPNKFRLNFFGGSIPLFCLPEDKHLVASNENDGSPCPEFWEWLPKAYNFDGDGNFTKYNMEVAFLAGKQSVASNDTHPPQHQQEPVAWKTDDIELYVREDKFGFYNIPLYTHPPKHEPCPFVVSTKEGTHHCSLSQRQPLTDERLELVGHADLAINNIYIFNGYGEEVPEGRTPIYAGYKATHGIKGEA